MAITQLTIDEIKRLNVPEIFKGLIIMIKDDFNDFKLLKSKGISAGEAYLEASKRQLGYFTCIRMLRSVYNLSLPEAKKITIIVDNRTQNVDESSADILERQQSNLLNILKIAANMETWEFYQSNEGKWCWTTYEALNGKETSSVEDYNNFVQYCDA